MMTQVNNLSSVLFLFNAKWWIQSKIIRSEGCIHKPQECWLLWPALIRLANVSVGFRGSLGYICLPNKACARPGGVSLLARFASSTPYRARDICLSLPARDQPRLLWFLSSGKEARWNRGQGRAKNRGFTDAELQEQRLSHAAEY